MTRYTLKTGCLVLAFLNSFAIIYYVNYLFFFMRIRFGYTDRDNLALAAFSGLAYMLTAWWAGRYGQKHGYFVSMRIGIAGLLVAMVAGLFIDSAIGQWVLLAVCSVMMSFTWPALEALVASHESREGVQRMIGIYNVVWAGANAMAYFFGGWLMTHAGTASLFWVPAIVHALQLIIVLRLDRLNRQHPMSQWPIASDRDSIDQAREQRRSVVSPGRFRQMAWLANPFAYVAANTIIPLIPSLAAKLGLSASSAGFFCSIWMFARFGAFWLLWVWTGWHYRFGWFIGAYLLMIACFASVLLSSDLGTLALSQIGFGLALGLIYSSSLYYSMDASEDKGEHGGLHESAIGAGLFIGPTVGAAALHFVPQRPESGTLAVAGLLALGLLALVALRLRRDPGG